MPIRMSIHMSMTGGDSVLDAHLQVAAECYVCTGMCMGMCIDISVCIDLYIIIACGHACGYARCPSEEMVLYSHTQLSLHRVQYACARSHTHPRGGRAMATGHRPGPSGVAWLYIWAYMLARIPVCLPVHTWHGHQVFAHPGYWCRARSTGPRCGGPSP